MSTSVETPETTLAVIATELRTVKEAVERIERSNQGNVTRNEWEQRNIFVNEKFAALEKELAARRVSWVAVAALGLSAAVILFDLIPQLAR